MYLFFFFFEKVITSILKTEKYQFWGDRYPNSISYFLKWILIFKKHLVITVKSLGSNERFLLIKKWNLLKELVVKPAEFGVFRYILTAAGLWPLNCKSGFFINLLITGTFTIALILPLIQESHCLLLSYRFQWIN